MENTNENAECGQINISDEVVATISGIATLEVEGVAGMSGGITGGLEKILGIKNLSKGVKVTVEETETIIDVFIIVKYGIKIPDISWQIQENVKKEVESMTGLIVKEVNINVQGVEMMSKEEVVEKQ